MTSVTYCHWLGCNLRKNCHRFTAYKEPIDTYFLYTPKKIADEDCEYFVGNTSYYKAIADKPEELKKRIEINNKKNLQSNTMPF